ncbi:SWIM zinc finger family protein [Marinicella gelatinilytica]|uniref:SWIM zinc finger family protein n=1 Tax=Marinicella gelatinilytica TaxID=2996017 RepID=UPI002260B3C8|nr:SWIM zinc finger family protein [Marinicella gelatinilytica]MCX7545117.1 SWIM zinc finger family protein [Marinicella gelatinilytica]
MNLNNFKDQIDSVIVERGADYYFDKAVSHLEQVDAGIWLSLVEGSLDYDVLITLDNNQIKEWQCNCPYDYGPVCKHVVATLYALADELEVSTDANNGILPKKKAGQKRKNQNNEVSQIFSKVNQQELQEFLQKQFVSNRGLKNALIAYFAEYLDEDINKKYQIIVKNIYKAAKGRDGFIDYRSTYKLEQPLYDLLKRASEFVHDTKIIQALAICKAIIEQLPKIVHNMDDSDGSAGGLFEYAFEVFDDISNQAHPELKDELFSYCLKEFPKEKYNDFGFESYFLDVLPVLITTDKQEKQLFAIIDKQLKKVASKAYSSYGVVQLIKVKIGYLLKNNRQDEVDILVNEHKHYPEFRTVLVQQSLDQKDFKQAKKLCQQGIIIAEKECHAGTVSQWREQLLTIAELEQNKADIRKWAKILFNGSYRDMSYYKQLKSTYSKKEWAVQCEAIIDEIKGKNQYGGYGAATQLADIFVAEKYFDRLLTLLQINPESIRLIDGYAHHLSKDYPQEIRDLYVSGIKKQAEETGRKIYNQTVKYIKTLSKIPGSQSKVNELIQFFKSRYKNRSAMMEILNKHFPKQFNEC